MDPLAELEALVLALLAGEPGVGSLAIVPDEVLRDELGGVLHEPEQDRVVDGDLALDPALEGQQEGANHALDLLDPVLDHPVALRLVGRGGLRHGLHPELLHHAGPEVHQGGLVVDLQKHPPVVPEAADVRDSLLDRVLEGPALAEDRVGDDGLGLPVLDHEHGKATAPSVLDRKQ